MKSKIVSLLFVGALSLTATAQQITPEMMQRMRSSYQPSAQDRAIRNAIGNMDMKKLVQNQDGLDGYFDTHFTYRVPQVGITDQKQSGRCWLFCGLNILRAQMRKANPEMAQFEFSQRPVGEEQLVLADGDRHAQTAYGRAQSRGSVLISRERWRHVYRRG